VNARWKQLVLPLLIIGAFAMPKLVISAEGDALTTAAAPPPTNAAPEPDPQLLRNFLLLQDQLRATQHAVEQAREEAQAESKRTSEIMAARLNLIEQTLNAQREQELESWRSSTRTMLTVVGTITGLGFIAVLFAGFVQVRAMARLAEVSQQLRLALPAPRMQELTAGGTLSASHEQIELANASLLGAIDRLQQRLEEMGPTAPATHTATNGHKQIVAPAANAQAVTIVGKGQALLNLDKPEQALEHFEEAISIDPRNVEAWIKKGTALERLQRIDDAIAAYDHAIATDNSTATAYLFKAGVYNRQKKYAEALQCYEKALSVQQKSRAAQPTPA
jgi:tetratricopeptide (TPR) repeat protein